ncbi:hypothetical protein BKA70DRAFT_1235159 [Coprinopsis sp. MPI-PUGE-AT-0042]|nr:hypothetical protein BKA70DRAFT_1235159 [Coprinopsis sp. MPI-PUGE-AT-0042]
MDARGKSRVQCGRGSQRDLVNRWDLEECNTREDIIKKKDTIIRCQQRRIHDLTRRLKEATDRLMAGEMQALVMDIDIQRKCQSLLDVEMRSLEWFKPGRKGLTGYLRESGDRAARVERYGLVNSNDPGASYKKTGSSFKGADALVDSQSTGFNALGKAKGGTMVSNWTGPGRKLRPAGR